MSAGKSANNAVNAWKAKMQSVFADIHSPPRLSALPRVNIPPPITLRLRRHRYGIITTEEYDTYYNQWVNPRKCRTRHAAEKYVREYYTGGDVRDICEMD